jgi:HK97 family phage prohead protease
VNTMELGLELQMREDAGPAGSVAVLYGRAVPYDTPTSIGGVEESFAPGAFTPSEVMGKPLAWRHGEPIGVITAASNQPDGLYITASILDTAQGRDAATLTRAGAVKGLSVGFVPTKSTWNRAKSAVKHITAQLAETSLTHMPAYATAGVSSVREEETPMEETTTVETPVVLTDIEAREAIASTREELTKRIDAIVHVNDAPASPYAQYRTLGEYSQAAFNGEVSNRAAPDQITSDNPGVIGPQWMSDVKNIVSFGRPAIAAVGVQSAGSTGLTFSWPFFEGDLAAIVAAQTAEKAALNTVLISLKKADASLVTYGAYSDISYQLLQRSQPSYLEAHNRIMLASYATITDNVFADALVAGGTASAVDYDLAADTTGALFRAAVFAASGEVESATGSPASVVLVSTTVFNKIGGWDLFVPAPYGTQNVPGTATASTLAVSVSGLRVVHDRNLAAGTILVTNGSAAAWIEDGPFFATAETPSKLGRDVAVYGYGVTAIYNAAGVVKITNLI